nr:PREDICTED: alkaline ceramidase 3 [Bemisia tabaci]
MAPNINSEELIGYWGRPTSTVDWCEKNYEFSIYVAEMSNTISNLMMILPPLWGIKEIIKYKLDKIFILCQILLLTVGLGSTAFHMTLLYEMQLFDELPMVWGTCVSVYILKNLSSEEPKQIRNNGQNTLRKLVLASTLFFFAVSFTTIYLWWPQPFFQHTSFAVLLFVSFYLQYKITRNSQCSLCQKFLKFTIFFFVFGFSLWIIDKAACSQLTSLRARIPVYFNPVTQLHSWWHIFAGYASYLQILLCIHSWYDLEISSSKKTLRFENGFSLRPTVSKKRR